MKTPDLSFLAPTDPTSSEGSATGPTDGPRANTRWRSERTRRRAGMALTVVPAIFLLVDGVLHMVRPQAVVQSFLDLGYPVGLARPLGVLALACLAVHLVPRTAPLGAVLLTGYLGGAVSAHARLQDPLLGATLFPVYLGVALWAGLWLRDHRLRALTTAPSRRPRPHPDGVR